MPKKDHPLGRWFDEDPERRTYEIVSAMCCAAGLTAGPDWIKQIAIGYDGPSYLLARFLSKAVTRAIFGPSEIKITVEKLMDYPYSRSSAA